MSIAPTTDVFIIGGGPAGLAAALSARMAGLTVTVADSATPPIDKACGEGLMPDAVAALANLGVHIGTGDGAGFEGVRFTDGYRTAEANFPSGIGVGIRRPALHRILLEHARDAGVSLLWGARVERTHMNEITLNGSKIQARWIIGADGHKSRVRRWADLHRRRRQVRFGFRRHYEVEPWTSRVEVYWGPDFEFVVTPVGAREVSVALLTRRPGLRVADALPHFPELLARVKDARPTTIERGALTSMMNLQSVFSGRFALIGDSSGSVDAITGEGLRLAFQQAVALGTALAAGDLALYQIEHQRIMRLPTWMSQLMLLMDRSNLIRRATLRTFTACPLIFAKLLAIHTGAVSPSLPQTGSIEIAKQFHPANDALLEARPREAVHDPR